MSKYLVIVESPGKIKSISKFLGKNYSITASVGHVRDLPKSKLGVDIENDFEPRYISIRGKGDVIKKLKKEAKAATKVFLATDPDREGEAISWHLANLLDIPPETECRISFNEITSKAVKSAVKEPRPINQDLVDAQQARRVLDRIVGYKISPLLWKKVKKGLSAGRVQSVALRIICEREDEIINFEPVEYWNLAAKLKKQDDKTLFDAKFYGKNNKKMELNTKEEVDKVLESIKDKPFVVEDVKTGTRRRSPAPPFITSTLQQEASRKLNFTTRTTMSVAQKLYEGVEIKKRGTIGLITYMRTDSIRVSNEALISARDYVKGKYGEEYLPKSPRTYKNKNASQDAHEAIRPTYLDMPPEAVKEFLPSDQFRLYKLIWDRFIASQMENAVYDTLAVNINVNDYTFKAKGSKIKFKGFMALYTEGKDDKNEEDKEISIPALEKGENLELKELTHEQKFTQPPARYNEATLVKTLEEKGIGRPSTYSAIITTISARGYVVKEKRFLMPTELGILVNNLMKEYFKDIVNVGFTADLESNLDMVEDGKIQWKQLMRDFYAHFGPVLEKAEKEMENVELPVEESDIVCEKCGRNMVYKQGRYGKFLACPGFPECRNTKPIIIESEFDCPKCGKKMHIRKDKRGKDYYTCEDRECGYTVFDKPSGEICSECNSFIVWKQYGRRRFKQCSNRECPTLKKSK